MWMWDAVTAEIVLSAPELAELKPGWRTLDPHPTLPCVCSQGGVAMGPRASVVTTLNGAVDAAVVSVTSLYAPWWQLARGPPGIKQALLTTRFGGCVWCVGPIFTAGGVVG